MINASELRVGNWLKSICRDGDGSIVQVKNIDNVGINFFASQAGYDYEYFFEPTDKYDYYWLEPIPITEEILRAVGFEDAGSRNVGEAHLPIKWKMKDSFTTIFNFKGEFEYVLSMDEYGDLEKSVTIKHLHQLQNLHYAVEQKELTYQPIL